MAESAATTYEVTIGERAVRVSLRRAGDDYVVRIGDGPEQPAALRHIHGLLHLLSLGQRRTELLGARTADGGAVALDGLEYRAEVIDTARARLASVAGGRTAGHTRRELKAPMPGLLVKLLCAEGDAIEAGQPLAVLQAMKMENELSVTRGGTVRSIAVEVGQTVEQGQVLLVVE